MISSLLIALAFIIKWSAENNAVFTGALAFASVLGVIPIAIQAYQALKVKVVSIDVLVTIAVMVLMTARFWHWVWQKLRLEI